jgi:hypothetical protein
MQFMFSQGWSLLNEALVVIEYSIDLVSGQRTCVVNGIKCDACHSVPAKIDPQYLTAPPQTKAIHAPLTSPGASLCRTLT